MFDAVIKSTSDAHGFHFVILCDGAGVFDAFNFIADQLEDRRTNFLSLIYTVSDRNLHPVFEQEFSILERRFSERLILHILRIDTKKYYFDQELLEETINGNVVPKMKFLVFGKDEFVNHVSGVLRFLDVKEFMINSKIICGAQTLSPPQIT
jgi:hypothetical protein